MNNSQTPMISVVCMTYNHEKYIGKALDGFLMQKTDFPFEVIVHDDASTDNTAQIIKDYENKYPAVIKSIIQKENQYSQGVASDEKFVFPILRGKYVAICEGDDYWIDPYKLQKQYDVLEAHPEIDMCAHAAYITYFDSDKKQSAISPAKNERIFSAEEVIAGGGRFVATASLLYRRELNEPVPPFRQHLPIDYMLQIQGSLRGGMYYISDFMSVYRSGSTDSWSEKMNNNKQLRIDFNNKIISALSELDAYSDSKFSEAVKSVKLRTQLENICMQRDYQKLKSGEINMYYKNLSIFEKGKIALKRYFPFLENLRYKISKSIYR